MPLLIQVPGEAAQLLGVEAEDPAWWTQARETTAAEEAGRLTTVLGGVIRPPEAAHTDVVPIRDDVTFLPGRG